MQTVTADMITEVAADFRLIGIALDSRRTGRRPTQFQQENNESLLRSLFRLLRTMDNTQSLEEKPVPSADGRRV